MRFIGSLREQVDRIYAHARVVIVAGGEQKQLLDTLIVQRALRFLRGNCVVFNADLIGAGLLRNLSNAADRSLCSWRGAFNDGGTLPQILISCANSASKPKDQD